MTRMSHTPLEGRLEQALHRGGHKASEQEVVEIAAVISELSDRVSALEARPSQGESQR